MIGASDQLFAEKAYVEDRDEGELGSELDPGKHSGNRRDDNDKCHRCEIALGLFVSFGEERDGHQGSGEKDGDGKSHEEDGDHRFRAKFKN